ncbi:MAG: translation elongation factor Ts [bacterium]
MEKIKQLREQTGAGMVDCKKALEESGGDIEKAVDILRKKGIANAAKRGERETSEGVIKVAADDAGQEGYVAEFNSETDFVARNEKFQDFTERVMDIIKTAKPKDRAELLGLAMDGGTVEDNLNNLSGVIGEKLAIKRFDILFSSGTVSAYSHMGGKIGVLVAIDKKDIELAHDIAMQIVAANPAYISEEEVPADEINKEKEIYKEQLVKEGKPENIMENIIAGKVKKYFNDVCLVEQDFIKEDKKKVKDVLGDAKVERFIRYSL